MATESVLCFRAKEYAPCSTISANVTKPYGPRSSLRRSAAGATSPLPRSPSAPGLSLADLRRDFTCKSDILKAFQAEVDAEVLAKTKPAAPEQSPRDRLFDIIMTRFEVMAPYKPALGRISRRSLLPSGRGRAAPLLDARLAILDAGRRRRQARRPWRGASRRRPCRDLRQGVPRLARRCLAWARPHHGGARPQAQGRARIGSPAWRAPAQNFCRFACGFMPRGWKRREAGGTAEPAAGGASPSPAGA